MDDPGSNPPRRSLFAIWHWSWWPWGLVVLLMLAVYLFSPPLIYRVLWELEIRPSQERLYERKLDLFYAPARHCQENSEILTAIWIWEEDVIDAVLDPP